MRMDEAELSVSCRVIVQIRSVMTGWVSFSHRYDGGQRLDAAGAERDVRDQRLLETCLLEDPVRVVPDLQDHQTHTVKNYRDFNGKKM